MSIQMLHIILYISNQVISVLLSYALGNLILQHTLIPLSKYILIHIDDGAPNFAIVATAYPQIAKE